MPPHPRYPPVAAFGIHVKYAGFVARVAKTRNFAYRKGIRFLVFVLLCSGLALQISGLGIVVLGVWLELLIGNHMNNTLKHRTKPEQGCLAKHTVIKLMVKIPRMRTRVTCPICESYRLEPGGGYR